MSNPAFQPEDMVTVFRSGDSSAEEDASAIVDLLADAGLNATLLTDEFPGVLHGTVEVRVPAEEENAALDLIDAQSAGAEAGSPSHGYDLVELYRGQGTTGEVEALSIRAVLDANSVPSVLVGTMQLPNLPFRVMVPQIFAETASRVLQEAEGDAQNDAQQLQS